MRNNKAHPSAASFDPRRSHRFDLNTLGEIVLLGRSEPCRVTEISRHGAKLETLARIRSGEDGLLRCDGLDLLFRVIRFERTTVIVEFIDEAADIDGEIDPELAALIENNNQILRFLDI